MKKILIILWVLLPFLAMAQQLPQQYTVSGASVLSVPYPSNPSFDPLNPKMEVYLVNRGTVNITSTGGGPFKWYKYTTGAPGNPITGETNATLTGAASDCGYYVVDNGSIKKYVWIVNYTQPANNLSFQSLTVSSADCEYVTLLPQITAPTINYYTNTGSAISIIRKYGVSFDTWDVATLQKKSVTEEVNSTYTVSAPLTDTEFTIFDWYAKELGVVIQKESDAYKAIAVTALGATAEVLESTGEEGDPTALSAPARGTFTAHANEPVAALYIWWVYKTDESTDNPLLRYTDKSLRYTFERSGNYQVRLDVSDRTSKCTDSKIYEYTVTDYLLEVPNAFSPGTSPGVNDEFRVAYRSITSFKAWIFNRSGQQLYYWEDPEQGWNGEVGGKLVFPGVYFYVIEAVGSDGKKHLKKGDINILRGR